MMPTLDVAVQRVLLTTVRTDGGTQPRAALDHDHVARLAEAMESGATLPPVLLFHDGEAHWLADGFHRLAAHHARGTASIAAEVRQGTRRDAVLYSVGANAAHGLPRSNADKRRAVETLLRDEEWARWSDREIARRAGVSPSTVGAIRSELSVQVGQIDAPRLVQRGGSVYEQAPRAVVTPPAPRPPPLPFAAQPPWPVVELDPDDADDDEGDSDSDDTPAEVVSVAHLDDADADDEGEDMSPLELPAPRIVARAPNLSGLDGADPAELAAVSLFVDDARQLRERVERFVDEHPFDTIRNARAREAYESAFVRLVKSIVARLPETLIDESDGLRRPILSVIRGGAS